MNIADELILWYTENKRCLPWRETKDPYKIWISEVILQQTRVIQGLGYYERFIEAYPTIIELASSSENKILKLWQGLGYYNRARNLHHTAKFIVDNYDGVFPNKFEEILRLKGIGIYTASAISSFAFNLPYAVVDGNVVRFLSRLFALKENFYSPRGQKIFQKKANDLLDKKKPEIYNQAIMDFGAIQCITNLPVCSKCIFMNNCLAYKKNKVYDYPLKKQRKKIKIRYIHYFLVFDEDLIFVKKRNKGIWKGLFDFPMLEFNKRVSEKIVLKSIYLKNTFKQKKFDIDFISDEILHILSHQKLYVRFWHINLKLHKLKNFKKISYNEISKIPLPRLIDKYILSVNENNKI